MSFSGNTDTIVDETVHNSGFWPSLEMAEFQRNYRLPAEYESDMVRDHLVAAMARTNQRLSHWQRQQESLSYSFMEDVPADTIGDDKITTIHYRRAVFCLAKALLLQQFKTVDRRAAANNDAKESEEVHEQFLEFADHAIADFLGTGRINVELL